MLRLLGLALLATLCVAAAPTAAEMGLSFTQPEGRLQPEGALAAVTATITHDCQSLLLRNNGADRVLTLEFDNPETLVVVGPLTTSFPEDACSGPEGAATVVEEYQVAITRAAPGLTPLSVSATAQLAPHASDDLLSTDREAEAGFTVEAAPYFVIEPRVQQKLQTVAGDAGTATLEVANHGNVRTKVVATPRITVGTMAPVDIVLDSPNALAAGGSVSGNLHLDFQAPAGDWSVSDVVLVITAVAADDPSLASTNVMEVSVRFVNGDDDGGRQAPLPAPPLVGLLLVAVALALRHRTP